jgi:hypothetical protein
MNDAQRSSLNELRDSAETNDHRRYLSTLELLLSPLSQTEIIRLLNPFFNEYAPKYRSWYDASNRVYHIVEAFEKGEWTERRYRSPFDHYEGEDYVPLDRSHPGMRQFLTAISRLEYLIPRTYDYHIPPQVLGSMTAIAFDGLVEAILEEQWSQRSRGEWEYFYEAAKQNYTLDVNKFWQVRFRANPWIITLRCNYRLKMANDIEALFEHRDLTY